MKFLCLCYYNTAKFAQIAPEQFEEIKANCTPHDKQMWATGKVVMVGSLSLTAEWKTAVPNDGRPQISDGPYVKIDDQAGAFVIVEAENMEEAMQVAFKHPAANYGERLGFAVEIRPMAKLQEQSPY
jgi:hypothetical protein